MESAEEFEGKVIYVFRENSRTIVGIPDDRGNEKRLHIRKIDLGIERGKLISGRYNPKCMQIYPNNYFLN